jgi:hypothetical protein
MQVEDLTPEEVFKQFNFKQIDEGLIEQIDYRMYEINKNCIIFNKSLMAKEVEVQIGKNVNFSDSIIEINEHLKWLNTDDCKKELINKFCEFVNSYSNKIITINDIIHNEWYETLTVQGAIINIPDDINKLSFTIICVDKWHILYIDTEKNKILDINDQYITSENGYDGIWIKR